MNRAVIALGSNIEPQQNIQKTLEILAQKFAVLAQSRFQQTKPFGKIKQADFVNGSVLIETALTVEQLRTALKDIETDLGRDQTENRWGPRTIDLDIVVWNDTITDKHFYKRDYLKESVLELIPELKY